MKVNAMTKNTTPAVLTHVVINAEVIEFAEQYKMCIKKTAESILELADVVWNAKDNLSKQDFKLFREQIGADETQTSYIKKLCVIASNRNRFDGLEKQLPASYTTLYDLARLKPAQFQHIIDGEIIAPTMSAQNIKNRLTRNSSKAITKLSKLKPKGTLLLSITLDEIDNGIAMKILKLVSRICDENNIAITSDWNFPNHDRYFHNSIETLEKLAA
jgi:hypothetical protein